MSKIWLIIIPIILFSRFPLKDQYFRKNFEFLFQFQYGDYLVQKWFLVIVAFSFFFWWIFKNYNPFKLLRQHMLPILIIFLVLLSCRFLSFNRWFDFDDYRVIGTHYDVLGTPQKNPLAHEQMGLSNSMYYAIGMVYLVVRWFDRNFIVYNAFGIMLYFFACMAIYAFINKVIQNKAIATLAAAFFATSPTYWRQTLMMQEQMGDGFGVLLTAIAYYFLAAEFFPGSVIFAATALEFGLSRTHYIGLPLLLAGLFFIKNTKFTKDRIIALFIFPLISLMYLPVFREYPMESFDSMDLVNDIPVIIRIFDTVFGTSVPNWLTYQVATLSKHLIPEYYYMVTPTLGFLISLSLAILSLILYKKKKNNASKFVFIGLIIMVSALIFPTLRGIRLVQEVKSLTSQYIDYFPGAPTSYGVQATFGVMLVFVGLSQLLKQKVFIGLAVILITLNSISWLKTDWDWFKQIDEPQKATNPQLAEIIPENGRVKVIYTSPPILARYVDYFYQLYRIREPLYFTNDASDFVKLVNKYNPNQNDIFLITMNLDNKYKITNRSDILNKYSVEKLNKQLIENISNKDFASF